MNLNRNRRGQAVVEMALFGSLILMLFASLLSYLQRANDQQYVQMEAFRRALKKANDYEPTTGGRGASVQLTSIQNRRFSDISESFRKGSSQTLSASSSVFWAVTWVREKPESAIVFKVNDDEKEIINDTSVKVEDINSNQQTNFSETTLKQETPQAITNTRTSTLKDTVTTKFINEDGNTIWEVTQGVYRDADGQYKYSSSQVGNEIERGRSWKTEF